MRPRPVVTHKRRLVKHFNWPTQSWSSKALTPSLVPRQFECVLQRIVGRGGRCCPLTPCHRYHPTDPDLLVFGTLAGEVVIINHNTYETVASEQLRVMQRDDPILGLAWLHGNNRQVCAWWRRRVGRLHVVPHNILPACLWIQQRRGVFVRL